MQSVAGTEYRAREKDRQQSGELCPIGAASPAGKGECEKRV